MPARSAGNAQEANGLPADWLSTDDERPDVSVISTLPITVPNRSVRAATTADAGTA